MKTVAAEVAVAFEAEVECSIVVVYDKSRP